MEIPGWWIPGLKGAPGIILAPGYGMARVRILQEIHPTNQCKIQAVLLIGSTQGRICPIYRQAIRTVGDNPGWEEALARNPDDPRALYALGALLASVVFGVCITPLDQPLPA